MVALPLTQYTDIRESMEHAVSMREQAIEIYRNPDSTAEDFEQADNIIKEAENIAKRCKRLDNIKTVAQDLLDKDQPKDNSLDPAWRSSNEFLRAVKNASERNVVDERLLQFHEEKGILTHKDMSGNVGATGGYVLTGERLAGIRGAMSEASIVMPRANVLPMNGRTLDITRVNQTGTTASQFHWYGGIITYWEGEADTITTSDMSFKIDTLTARMIAGATVVPNTTLADSGDALDAIITGERGFGGALASAMDYAFLRGDGVNKPLGVLNSGALKASTRTTSSTIKYDDLINIVGNTLPGQNYVWVANIGTRSTLLGMNGPSGNPSYLWGDATNGIPGSLLGFPIIWSEKVPALGTQGDIGLYDFSHYYVGDRQSITVDTDTSLKFLQNSTVFKAIARVDGQPWIETVFTLYDGSTTVSPFCTVAT